MDADGVEMWRSLERTGADNPELARLLGVNVDTVRRWRARAAVSIPSRQRDRVQDVVAELAERARLHDVNQLTSDLRKAITSASTVLNRLAALTPDQVLASVLSALSRCDPNPRITVAPAYRGRLSWDTRTPLHYLVGIDLLRADSPDAAPRPVDEVTEAVAAALSREWRDHGLHLRRGSPPEWSRGDRPAVVLQIPIIERPRIVSQSERLVVPSLGRKLIVLSPIYGYGEMIAALLAEALGWGLADLRYEEDPPSPVDLGTPKPDNRRREAARQARERRARELTGPSTKDLAFCVAGGRLLKNIRPELEAVSSDTSVIAVSYGSRWAERGQMVHGTPVSNQLRNGRDAVAIARDWRGGGTAMAVEYSDDDVCVSPTDDEANIDRIADATLTTAVQILDQLGIDEREWRTGWVADLRRSRRLGQIRESVGHRRSEVAILSRGTEGRVERR